VQQGKNNVIEVKIVFTVENLIELGHSNESVVSSGIFQSNSVSGNLIFHLEYILRAQVWYNLEYSRNTLLN